MKRSSVMVRMLGAAMAMLWGVTASPAGAQERADTTTMIVVDMSGSMLKLLGSERRYEIAQTMLTDVLPDVTAQSNTGLVAFGHRSENDCSDIELLAKPGADLDSLRGYVGTLSPVNRAKTPLRDAVALAANQIPSQSEGAIVVVSDGEDNCGVNVCDLVPNLQDRDIPVFLLGIALEAESVEQMQCLTSETGGFLIQTESAAELPRYTDFLFRLSRLRTANASLKEMLSALRARLSEQEMVQSDLENQIVILTQRLKNADRTADLEALQAEIIRLRNANDSKQKKINGLEATILMLEQDHTTLTAKHAAKLEEIERLKALIAQLEDRLAAAMANQRDGDEVDALTAEIERLTVLVGSLREEIAAADITNAQLQNMLDELSAEKEDLAAQNAELLLQIQSLTTAVERLDGDNSTLRAEIARLEALLADKAQQLLVLQTQIGESSGKDARIAELMARITMLEDSEQALRTEVNSVAAKLATKDRTIANRDSTIEQLRETIESLNGLLARKNAVIASLNEQISSLRVSLDGVANQDAEIARLNATIDTMSNNLGSNEVTINDLTLSLQDAQASIENLSGSSEANKAQITTLSQSVSAMNQRADELAEIVQDRDQTIIMLMDQLAQAQRMATEAENSIVVLREEAAVLLENQEGLEQQIIVLEGQKSEWVSDRRTLTIERDEAVAARGEAGIEIDAKTLQITTIEDENDALSTLIIDLRDRLNAAYADIDILKAENDELRDSVATLEAELEERARIIDELMIQLATINQERDALLVSNSMLTETNDELRSILVDRDTDIERLSMDLRLLRTTLDEARMALGDERIRTRRLHIQLEDARRSFLSLLSACHSGDEMDVLAQVAFEELGAAAQTCIGNHASLIIERDTLIADLQTMTEERNRLRTTLDEQEPTYAELRDHVALLEAQQERLVTIIAAASGNETMDIRIIERDLTIVIEERDRLAAELSSQDPAYELVVSRLSAVAAENQRLSALLERQDPDYDIVIAQLEQVTRERDHVIGMLDSQNPSYIVLKSQVQSLTNERDRLLALVSAQDPSYDAIANRLEAVTIERDRLSAALAEQTPSYAVIKAQLEEALIELESCQTRRRNMSEELQRLQRVVRENNVFIESQRSQLGDQEAYIARLITGTSSAAELAAVCAAQ